MIRKIVEGLSKKRLEKRISSAILMIAMLVSISGIIGGIAIGVISNRYNDALVNYGFSQGDIGKMLVTFADTRSNMRAVIGYQDSAVIQDCFEEYNKKKEACQGYADSVKKTLTSNAEKEKFADIESKMNDYWTLADKVIEMGKTTDVEKRIQAQKIAKEQVSSLYDTIYVDMAALMDLKVKEGNNLEKNLMILQIILIAVIIIIIVAAVIIAKKLGEQLAANIVRPLNKLGVRLRTFAEGDLTSEFPEINTEDEVSEMVNIAKEMADNIEIIIKDVNRRMELMAKNDYTGVCGVPERYVGDFAAMNESIHEMNMDMNKTLHHIEEAAAQVSIGATNLAEGSQNLAEGSTDQAGAVEELLASFTNIVEGVEHTHDSAKASYKMCIKYADEADKTQQEMLSMTDSMQRLNEMSKKIENIIGDIEEIAEQTNLLALNASIEAARAGEAGRGFAVVASQIGALADESATSAVNTRELIMNSIKEIESGNQIVENTAEKFTKLVDGINLMAENSKELQELAETQAEQIKQAEAGVNQISEVVQSNAAIAEESSATSEELSAESIALNELVQQFKLKD